jgi:hypothetical protein
MTMNTEMTDAARRPGLKEWLFDPFTYVAGGKALGLGLIAILAAGVLGYFGNTHFDGVFDLHTGRSARVGLFLLEGLVDWLALAITLWIAGKIVSRTTFRAVDLFGTQALARWPTVVAAAVALLPAYQRSTTALNEALMRSLPQKTAFAMPSLPPADLVGFIIALVVILATTVFMVALMYRAYSVCCNIRGGKGAVSFIIALVAAEIIAVVLIRTILIPLF